MINRSAGMERLGKVAIVGSGALGGYVGACLARAGANVHFLVRSDYEAIRKYGLSIERDGETFTIEEPNIALSSGDIGPSDLVIIALKTTQSSQLPELLRPLLSDDTVLLTLQNGMGNVEFLSTIAPAHPILAAVVYMAINRLEPGHIRNFSRKGGYMDAGAMHEQHACRLPIISECMLEAGIDFRTRYSFKEALWRKLIWNVPFNGLTIAAGGVTCDRVLDNPALLETAIGLMKELQAAARADGCNIPDSFIEHQVPFTRPLGPYRPSSLVDFQAGREVEVEPIWGEPLRRGQSMGVSMPHLETLYALLSELGAPKRN